MKCYRKSCTYVHVVVKPKLKVLMEEKKTNSVENFGKTVELKKIKLDITNIFHKGK